ncbi:MAG: hypothetical protein NZM25_04005 [Leptospiraceae bacterium]|nr:hypothetical protein [Leptospiraceae bacterium]MDW8306150.1 glycoside hydrolase family 31 protein [Leptospiraceae bacterium]
MKLKKENLLLSFYGENCCRLSLGPSKTFPSSIALVPKLSEKPQHVAQVLKSHKWQKQPLKVSFQKENFSFEISYSKNKQNNQITGRIFDQVGGYPALAIDFEKNDRLMGLGAAASGLWRNDTKARLLNIDTVFYRREGEAYSTFPFLWKFNSKSSAAIFLHTPLPLRYEGGTSEAVFYFERFDENDCLDIFFFFGNPAEILASYAKITGLPYLPPLWALGFHQSRWSYKSEKKVLEIAKKMREHSIPCDAIYLDIHYMQDYKVFTFHPKNFSDPKKMTSQLEEMGIKTVAIVDPGVKVEHGYPVYEEGLKHDVFCKKKNGDVYVGKVWPGNSVFPDFSREEVRHFWASWHDVLFRKGIRGIWNDMNDPVLQIGKDYDPLEEDIWHNGQAHYRVRNLYANYEALSSWEGFERYLPGERPFILTRSAFSGIQRYAALWTGDNHSSWEHLRLNLEHVLNLSLSGVPFCGADIGGFGGGPGIRGIFKFRKDRELMARWLELGYLMPFFRMHTVLYSYDQEPWSFGEEILQIARKYIRRRYRFLPYLYLLFLQASKTGEPIVRPLLYEYPHLQDVTENLFLVGKNLLAAAVLEKGQREMELTLPEGLWYHYETGELLEGNKTYRISTPINSHPLFVRAGTALPTAEPMRNTYDTLSSGLIWDVFPSQNISGEYYLDDGKSPSPNQYYRMVFYGKEKKGELEVTLKEEKKGYEPSFDKIFVRLPQGYNTAIFQGKEITPRLVSLQSDGRDIRISEFLLPRRSGKITFKKT